MAKRTRRPTKPAAPESIDTLIPEIREAALRLADGDRSRILVRHRAEAVVR